MESENIEVSSSENAPKEVEDDTKIENDLGGNNSNKLDGSLRMQIKNLPKHVSFQQLKKLFNKQLPKVEYRKLKICEDKAYVSFFTPEGLQKGLEGFNGYKLKNNILLTKHVAEEVVVERRPRSPKPLKTAKELTTPLANLSYEQQLKEKQKASFKVALNLKKQCIYSGIGSAKNWNIEALLKTILPSPVTDKYRNKSEHTVGYDDKGEICVGIVATRLQDKQLTTVPVYECPHMRQNTLNINRAFEEYIKKSGLPPFDEFERKGFWRTILIRDFLSDCMVVLNVFPFEDQELFEKTKKELIEVFMSEDPRVPKSFRVTSLYIAVQRNASDEPQLEKLAGAPFVYERLFDIKFRISPNTFFQTNTVATEVLYTAIGDALGLPKAEPSLRLPFIAGHEDPNKGYVMSTIKEIDEPTADEPAAKKAKIESSETESGDVADSVVVPDVVEEKVVSDKAASTSRILLLDICCGAGTIGLCLAKRVADAKAQGKFAGIFGLLGIELVDEAVVDARLNARDNYFKPETYRYLPGKAEVIFNNLDYLIPDCFKPTLTEQPKLQTGEIVGVLDPPRAGMPDKVIIGCRKLVEMKRLVYVSCDPNAALKNLIDLCRPTSKKYEGIPFSVTSIQPVDMFPLTSHFEWVIELDR